jgi:hypothetical protein
MMAFAISALLAVPAAAQSADRFKQPLGLTRRRSSTNYRRDEASATNARRRGALQVDGSVLDAAAKDPEVMKTLRETAFAADKELIAPMMWWRYNGQHAARARRTD